jgi:tetratricopeptide (TPR) repeat protein
VDWALRWGLLGVLALGALWLGGARYVGGLTVSALGVTLGLVAWARAGGRWVGGPIGWALVAWVVVTAAQVVVWPGWLVGWLQPQTVAYHEAARAMLGEASGGGVTVSLSVNRTAAGLWHALGMLGVFVAASSQLGSRKRFAWFLARLVGVGALFGVAAVVQTVAFEGSDQVLGMLSPQTPLSTLWQGVLRTPLVNANNAASLLGVMSLLSLGQALAQQEVGRRALLWALYGALALGMCLTLSRGGIAAWALAHGLLWVAMRGGHGVTRRAAWGVGVGVVMAAVAAAWWLGEQALRTTWHESVDEWRRVEARWQDEGDSPQPPTPADAPNTDASPAAFAVDSEASSAQAQPPPPARLARSAADASKILIYKDMQPMLRDFMWLGIGRGAFAEVYPAYAGARAPKTYSSAENEYLEVAAEYGVVFALLLVGLLGWGVGRAVLGRRWREQDKALVGGVAMALGMIALHNLVDFNARVPALGQVLAALLGLLAGREAKYRGAERALPRGGQAAALADTPSDDTNTTPSAPSAPSAPSPSPRSLSDWRRIWGRWGEVVIGGAGALAVLGVALGVLGRVERGVEATDVTSLRDQARAGDAQALMAQAGAVVRERPVDGYISFVIGAGLARAQAPAQALPWLDRAKALHRFDDRVELARGLVFAALGRPVDAAAAFRAAASLDRGSGKAIAASIVQALGQVDDVMASLSDSPQDWLQVGMALLSARRYADAIEVAARLQRAHPSEPEGWVLAYQAADALGFPEAALAAARDLATQFDDQPNSFAALHDAHLRLRPPDVEGALAALQDGLKRHPKSDLLLRLQAHLLLGPGKGLFDGVGSPRWRLAVEETLDAWRPAALANRQTRPIFYHLRGEYHRLLGHDRQALQAYQAALAARPTQVASQVGAFDAALRLGLLDDAAQSLRVATERLPPKAAAAMRARLDRCRDIERKGGAILVGDDGQCVEGATGEQMRRRLSERRLQTNPSP